MEQAGEDTNLVRTVATTKSRVREDEREHTRSPMDEEQTHEWVELGLENDERAELQTHACEIERCATRDLTIRGGNLDKSELVTTLPARRLCKQQLTTDVAGSRRCCA
jgi:hypothetical protein